MIHRQSFITPSVLPAITQVTTSCLFLQVPRESFFPWKRKAQLRKRASNLSQTYRQHDDYFYLLRMRPKKELGLNEGATPGQLQFLVHTLYRNKDVRLIPLLERWIPGVGEGLILRRGYHVYQTTGQLPAEEVIGVLNALVAHPNFASSAFGELVAHFEKSLVEDCRGQGNENVQKQLDKLRRQFRS